ncbi:MAG: CHAT domain-containing protein [Prochlorotrichaceae cyanobacterium]
MFIPRLFSIAIPWVLSTAPALLAQNLPTEPEPSPQLSQAQQSYQNGNYAEAIGLWTQALQSDRLSTRQQTQVQSYLAQTYAYQGQWQKAHTALTSGFDLLQTLPDTPDTQSLAATLLTTESFILSEQGQWDAALSRLQEAYHRYEQIPDQTGLLRTQLNQAQILKRQGNIQQALKLLTTAQKTIDPQPNSPLKAAIYLELGTIQRSLGLYTEAQETLAQSETLFAELNAPSNQTAALMALGDNARDQLPRLNQRLRSFQQQIAFAPPNSRGSSEIQTRSAQVKTQQENASQDALGFYRQASETAPTSTLQVKALTQEFLATLALESVRPVPNWSSLESLRERIQRQLPQLPPSLTSVYTRLNLAEGLLQLQQNAATGFGEQEIVQFLATTLQDARSLGDPRAEAQVLGQLGLIYEQQQQWGDAQRLTTEALNLAQAHPDLAYPLYWQLGRSQVAQGQVNEAIDSYTQSIQLLESLRSDLTSASPDVRYSFRESVEPVYRQLVSLLLSTDTSQHPKAKNLIQARSLIESLQIAELVNFFQVDCDLSSLASIDELDPESAVIYPIILSDRLEVIAKLPGQPLQHYSSTLSASRLMGMTNLLRQEISSDAFSRRYLSLAQGFYDSIIRPLEPSLAANGIQNLVFVLDGPLRNLPMAVLHDGSQFLVEKYAIALTPGLQLFQPQPLQEKTLRTLVGGLTEARQNFEALPNVQLEVDAIQQQTPSEVLLNDTFLEKSLAEEIKANAFPIVHLATHGEFGSTAEDTFILTWDDRVDVNELSELLQQGNVGDKAIELLIFSACRTAVGDDRAALGLAGIAVRSGARSTLASLWYISDEATSVLMSKLYESLSQQNMTKAEAVRQAQLELLRNPQYENPYYWAPFVLVGNWL